MQTMKIFLAFILIMILGFFAVGFSSSVTPPTAGTDAANQYANLTQAVGIANNGTYAVLLILILAMVFSGVVFLMSSLKTRRS